MRLIAIFLLLILLLPPTLALRQGQIKLLAVATDGDEKIGSVADLALEVQRGQGRVFIDTYPLTKLDTQFSTRFAKSIACDYLDIDCSKYDFFYTIKSNSAIIGGPSAGAAITLLTISVLSDDPFPDGVAVTGTINSGGIIGPVAGINEKVMAAKNEGLNVVIIPALSFDNATVLDEFIENTTGIVVKKAFTIDEAMFILTGKKRDILKDISVDNTFEKIMSKISDNLCNETKTSLSQFSNVSLINDSMVLYEKAISASQDSKHYSSASYCFGANLKLREILFSNKSDEELIMIYNNLSNDINYLDRVIDSINIMTIADLQTYMIVKERLLDADEYLKGIRESGNLTNISSSGLAFSYERYKSAVAWSGFFGSGNDQDVKYDFNPIYLRRTCVDKIEEVRSLVDYVTLYISIPMDGINNDIDQAYKDLKDEDYELCIFKASKAKARVSLVLEALSISSEQMQLLLDQKIEIAQQNIARVQEKGIFPLLGYSYFEYAKSLKDDDPSSALLYIGYASELSNLNVYFEREKDINIIFDIIDYEMSIIYLVGVATGILVSILFIIFVKRSKTKKNSVTKKSN